MMQEAGREVGRITLAELLALAQREAVIATDFRYAALLAPAGRYQRRAPICCDTADAEPLTQVLHAQYIERLQQNHPPSYHVVLRDATLFGQGAVVSAGGALLDDSCWEFFSQGGLPPGLTGAENRHYRLAKAPSRHIDRPSLLVKRPFWRNYGHWVMDGAALLTWLPRLQLPADCQLIVGPHEDAKMRAIMRETLDILAPGRPVIEQPDDEVWTVASLHYVTPPHIPPLTKQPAVMAALSGRLCALQPGVPATRRLYVTRDAGLGRRLVNEDQVIALCQHLGFEIVRPEHYSLREQVALFQSASCVLGVKGAALSNALFCSSAARLFVLSPSDWPDPFFWDLAAQRGLAYGEMFGPVHSDGERQSMHMFEIDIPRLARNLATFCQPTPAPGAPVVPAAVG
jgi:capsular polysaccharide biosynthesis protein